jgi:hypothetical protein
VDQGGEDLLEHHSVGDAAPVTPKRMGRVELGAGGQQGGELDPPRFDQRCRHGGHGRSSGSRSVSTSMITGVRARTLLLRWVAPAVYCRSL